MIERWRRMLKPYTVEERRKLSFTPRINSFKQLISYIILHVFRIMGTDESLFTKIFAKRSFGALRNINQVYETVNFVAIIKLRLF